MTDLSLDQEEPLIYFGDSTPKPKSRPTLPFQSHNIGAIPPSSPQFPSPEASLLTSVEKPKLQHRQLSHTVLSPHPSMFITPSSPPKHRDHPNQRQSGSKPVSAVAPKSSHAATTLMSESNNQRRLNSDTSLIRSSRVGSLASARRDAIPTDRIEAAKARLKQKQEVKKGKAEGKENVLTL